MKRKIVILYNARQNNKESNDGTLFKFKDAIVIFVKPQRETRDPPPSVILFSSHMLRSDKGASIEKYTDTKIIIVYAV